MRKVIDSLNEIYGKGVVDESHQHSLRQAVSILEAIEEYEVFHERLKVTDYIWAYYITAQDAGHTELMKQGIDNYERPLIVVVGAESQKEQFKGFKCVHFSKLADVAGTGYPLAWDNMALVRIFSSFSMIESAFKKISEILK